MKSNKILFASPRYRKTLEKTNIDSFIIQGVLGKGTFGEVMQAKNKKTGEQVAIKKIHINFLKENGIIDQIVNEVKIMYSLCQKKSRHIVQIHDHFEDDEYIYLIMECANGGQLMDKLNQHGKLREKTAARILRDVVLGLEVMHNQKVVHRDIKPENILLDEEGRAKLADFGWSNTIDAQQRQTFCGTPDYLAPEMIESSSHNESVDIWCLGVLLVEMVTGWPPFTPVNIKDFKKKQNKMEENILGLKYNLPSTLSPNCINLIKGLIQKKPDNRLKIPQIKSHPWFSQLEVYYDENDNKSGKEMMDSVLLNDSDPFTQFMKGNTPSCLDESQNFDSNSEHSDYDSQDIEISGNLNFSKKPKGANVVIESQIISQNIGQHNYSNPDQKDSMIHGKRVEMHKVPMIGATELDDELAEYSQRAWADVNDPATIDQAQKQKLRASQQEIFNEIDQFNQNGQEQGKSRSIMSEMEYHSNVKRSDITLEHEQELEKLRKQVQMLQSVSKEKQELHLENLQLKSSLEQKNSIIQKMEQENTRVNNDFKKQQIDFNYFKESYNQMQEYQEELLQKIEFMKKDFQEKSLQQTKENLYLKKKINDISIQQKPEYLVTRLLSEIHLSINGFEESQSGIVEALSHPTPSQNNNNNLQKAQRSFSQTDDDNPAFLPPRLSKKHSRDSSQNYQTEPFRNTADNQNQSQPQPSQQQVPLYGMGHFEDQQPQGAQQTTYAPKYRNSTQPNIFDNLND